MTKQELHALKKVMEQTKSPCVTAQAYDEHMRPVKVEQEVPGVDNHKLLDSAEYKAGYRKAWQEVMERLEWLFLCGKVTKATLVKYAGKAK